LKKPSLVLSADWGGSMWWHGGEVTTEAKRSVPGRRWIASPVASRAAVNPQNRSHHVDLTKFLERDQC
jgi:hypothetical protein